MIYINYFKTSLYIQISKIFREKSVCRVFVLCSGTRRHLNNFILVVLDINLTRKTTSPMCVYIRLNLVTVKAIVFFIVRSLSEFSSPVRHYTVTGTIDVVRS